MEFIKVLKKNCYRAHTAGEGSLIIANGQLIFRINSKSVDIKEIGIIKNGVGVEVKKALKPRKSRCIMLMRKYDKDDIPVELQGEKYRFKIPAEKISDTEYVFMFKKAKMLNKK